MYIYIYVLNVHLFSYNTIKIVFFCIFVAVEFINRGMFVDQANQIIQTKA